MKSSTKERKNVFASLANGIVNIATKMPNVLQLPTLIILGIICFWWTPIAVLALHWWKDNI